MRYLILILFSILLFTACQKAETQQTASPDAKRYPLKGTVISVDKANRKAQIAHEEIPGYMEPMTMNFSIKDTWVWEDLTEGSEVRGDLVVDKDGYWLEKISIVAAPRPGQSVVPINENFAQIGKEVPDFAMTNQDGKRISFKDFQGKALAITFIYAQCPLPDYCIAMSRNFSDLANQLQNESDLKDKIRLLSISFDPERDTPEKLKQYGLGYLGKDAKSDFTVWQLATAPDKQMREIADFFGLRYQVDETDKTQFNHSLITVVISPEGKVTKIFKGSEWTNADLLRELKTTLK